MKYYLKKKEKIQRKKTRKLKHAASFVGLCSAENLKIKKNPIKIKSLIKI